MILGLRKTQYTGGSFYIGIPQGWAIKNQLKKGETLVLELNLDGTLKVSKNGGVQDD